MWKLSLKPLPLSSIKVLSDVMFLFVLFLSVNNSQGCYIVVTLSALCCVNASNNWCYWIFFAVHIYLRFPNLHYVGFFQLHRSTFPVSWKQIIYLQLPLDDVVHGWLAISVFFLSNFRSYSACQLIIPYCYCY